MKYLVYTCVIGNYDRVYPIEHHDPDLEYVIITDNEEVNVKGWRSIVIDRHDFGSAREANRFYKMKGHPSFSEYRLEMYVDGNVRILSSPRKFFDELLNSGEAIMLFKHSRRDSVNAELQYCIDVGKVTDAQVARDEVASYSRDGFPDDGGLIEATILLKRNDHPKLEAAMDLWWRCYRRHCLRDQLSLPYVIWKTGIPVRYFDFDFRKNNPFFGVFPHWGDPNVRPIYAYMVAKAYSSVPHALVVSVWHTYWEWRQRVKEFLKIV